MARQLPRRHEAVLEEQASQSRLVDHLIQAIADIPPGNTPRLLADPAGRAPVVRGGHNPCQTLPQEPQGVESAPKAGPAPHGHHPA